MSTVITRTNLIITPCPTAASGAPTTNFSVSASTLGGVTNTVSPNLDQGSKVVRILTLPTPATNNSGTRMTVNVNTVSIPAGTTFWFSCDVFIPSNVLGTGLQCYARDDGNADIDAATFDASTPNIKVLTGIARDQWVRVSWKATVKSARTITAFSICINATPATINTWWETSRWMAEISNAATASAYFDGDFTDDLVGPETNIYDWSGTAWASQSIYTKATYNHTLTLSWLDDQGAVRFAATDMMPNETVFMVGPSNRLVPLRGYEDASWHEGSTDGYGYHYEMPLGMTVWYCIADVGADYLDGTMAKASIVTPENEAWLRDLVVPQLSQKVAVVSTDDEVHQGRQTLITIAGRQNPLSLYDVRLSRSGTITLLVINQPGQAWGDTSKEHIDALLYSGRPLLFSMCMSKGFPPLYMSANDVTYTKVSSSTRTAWIAKINYQEVDNPTDVGLSFAAEVTWDMSRSMPVPNATYQQWKDSYPTFLDLVLDRPTSIPGRDLE